VRWSRSTASVASRHLLSLFQFNQLTQHLVKANCANLRKFFCAALAREYTGPRCNDLLATEERNMKSSTRLSRRTFVATSAAAALLSRRALAKNDAPRTIGSGFSLYGMKSLTIADALKTCAEIGYDCVELPVMVDWPGDSAKLDGEARTEIRRQLATCGLRLSALMENLPIQGDDAKRAANLERLKLAAQLARDLAPADENGQPPLVETILGGKPGEFDAVKGQIVLRLKEWAMVLEDHKIELAIKAHVSNATPRPEQLLWLLEQVASRWLVGAYDYSHFQLQGLKMSETMGALLPRTRFIHVKDTEHAIGKRGFLLPGEGSIDYAEYFKLLAKSEYRGDVVVEVSGQVFSKPGYEPALAARKCYNHLAPAMERAGIKRD
jgi:sugar phosphate isomerase/epimerase